MKTLLLLAVCSGCLCLMARGDLADFGLMITYVTGHSPTEYVEYGCHCGQSGQGQPLDETDWCCFTHDCCYDSVSSQNCNPKFDHYHFEKADGDVTCEGDRCGMLACECDKAATSCFKANRKTYKLKYAPFLNVFCKGTKPAC